MDVLELQGYVLDVGTSGICFGWALRIEHYELVVMPIMYYRFPPYIRGGLQIGIEGQSFLITSFTVINSYI
jgi:hypothetical protein